MATKSSRVQSSKARQSGIDGMHNEILRSLPRKEYGSISAKLERVILPVQTVLHEASQPINFGYFLNKGLASILTVMSNGKRVEVASWQGSFIGTPLVAGGHALRH
jgi:CRP-like cAMP-binding protein